MGIYGALIRLSMRGVGDIGIFRCEDLGKEGYLWLQRNGSLELDFAWDRECCAMIAKVI